ncbi:MULTISPECIES: MFS transporter [Microbacterium]|uniref:MFS transporter n=1 Tax=Microbacterium hominis TaxID=162426 RepID=A0A2K9D876_9MICO|nr:MULTISPECIES: MFS transporter [Microbacterium]AUG29800.1 MFS transporter [Microbacterium hominis]
MRLGRRGAFWAAASVLALALWSSGAPSVLYPIYAAKWDLTPVVVTTVFATYQLALIVVLPLFGNLSDLFGRRWVMIAGVALIGISGVVFAFAPHVVFLYIGRVLQGAGAGLAMGAATASLIENNTTRSPRFASTTATVATATGLTVALLLSGVFAEYRPLPLLWSYLVLFALAAASTAALLATPDDRPQAKARWRPQAPFVPPGIRIGFVIATLSVSLAYCVGAIFLSLGAHMIDQFTHTDNTALVGTLLAASAAFIGITGLFLARFHTHSLIWAGTALTLVSLALMAAASALQSLALFLAWCVVGGIAYALAFTGGLGLINRLAPPHHRGSTLSFLYLIAYALQAATAIGVGAVATAISLRAAVGAAAIAVTVLAIAVGVLLIAEVRKGNRPHTPQ